MTSESEPLRLSRRRLLGSALTASGAVLITRAPASAQLLAAEPDDQEIPLDGAFAVAASRASVALLDTGRLTVIDRQSGVSEEVTLPDDFRARTVAFDGEDLLVGGGVLKHLSDHSFELGDYAAVQPEDLRDEPGVEDWAAGGHQTIAFTTLEPALFRVGAHELEPATPGVIASAVGDLGGTIALLVPGRGTWQVFIEQITAYGHTDGFRLRELRASSLTDSAETDTYDIAADGAWAHETAVAVGFGEGRGGLVVLASNGRTRLARTTRADRPRVMEEGPSLAGRMVGVGPAGQVIVTDEEGQFLSYERRGGTWAAHPVSSAAVSAGLDGQPVNLTFRR